jgi:NAD(P)-dependent dehydrogenase (short-subunit alcohol dehydrogenase family)
MPVRSDDEQEMTMADQPVSPRLKDRVAIVTGAGGGIGRQHALLLARHGAKVVVNDIGLRSGADAKSVANEIRAAGGDALASHDSATWEGAQYLVDAAVEVYGRVDILINNATYTRLGDLADYAESDWDSTLDVNLKGYFAMIRYVAPYMCKQGSGVIVNTSSASGYGHPSHAAYAAAKEGVVGLTRTVAREFGRFGVRCNAIRPLAAGQSAADFAARAAKWADLVALTMSPRVFALQQKLLADPGLMPTDKIAPFVVWLCTDAARNVNGHTFEVHGDTISRVAEPALDRTVVRDEGWDLDSLDAIAPVNLVDGLVNQFALEDHPELRTFGA